MSDINRGVVIIRPKQPFLEWLHAWDAARYTLEEISEDSTAYLVPQYTYDKEQIEILEDYFDYIFENELWSWCTDESMWPQERTFEIFLEWFSYEFHSMAFDLDVNTPLEYLEDQIFPDNLPSNGH